LRWKKLTHSHPPSSQNFAFFEDDNGCDEGAREEKGAKELKNKKLA
jgi:hypothetical protein